MGVEFTKFDKLLEMAKIIADKLDMADGKKDNKISGSIWNDYINNNLENGNEYNTDKKKINIKDVLNTIAIRIVSKAKYREDAKQAYKIENQEVLNNEQILETLTKDIPKYTPKQNKEATPAKVEPAKTEVKNFEVHIPKTEGKKVEEPKKQETNNQKEGSDSQTEIKSKFDTSGALKNPNKNIKVKLTVADSENQKHDISIEIEPSYLNKKYPQNITTQEKLNLYLAELRNNLSKMNSEEINNFTNEKELLVKDQSRITLNTNVKFDQSGNSTNTGTITGNIEITDAEGKTFNLPINIDSSVLKVRFNNQDEKSVFESISKQLTDAFANLSPEVLNDLKNEIRSINICRHGEHAGFYKKENDSITLVYQYGENDTFLGSLYSGITQETIAHEIGHAVHTLYGDKQNQEELEKLFNDLTAALKQSNIDLKDKTGEFYCFSDYKEAFAEWYASKHGADKETYMNKLSNCPEPIKTASKNFMDACERILQNSRSKTAEERKGVDAETINKKIADMRDKLYQSDNCKKALSDLAENIGYPFTHDQKILESYVDYLEKGETSEFYETFDVLKNQIEENDPDDKEINEAWTTIKKVMDDYLNKIGYFNKA